MNDVFCQRSNRTSYHNFFLKSYIARTDTVERFIENIDINYILLQHSQPSIFAFKVQIQPPIKLAGGDNEA